MGSLYLCPVVDADITGAADIVFNVGAGDLTATVRTPTAASLTYGWYLAGEVGVDDLLEEVAAQMSAVDTETWTASYVTDGGVWKARLTRGGVATAVTIKWTAGGTTFNGQLLGFDTSSNSTGAASVVTGGWQVARLWRCDTSSLGRSVGARVARRSRALSGLVQERVYGGWTDWELVCSGLHAVQLFLYDSANAGGIASSPFASALATADPHFPLEHLWGLLQTYKPLRYVPTEGSRGSYHYLSLGSQEWLSDLRAGLSAPLDSARRVYTLTLPASTYVP